MSVDFRQELSRVGDIVNRNLDRILSQQPAHGELERPERLVNAMRHGVLNGGKRLRPFLVIKSSALFGLKEEAALITACALECLHSYSLIHDDLPAMDDDDLRRGKPTVHKAFDEATAILAGDALLTLAFELITSPDAHPNPSTRAELASLLARAAGQGGMVGGQILDLAAEQTVPSDQEIRKLQSMKTGALIRFACEAGAVLGGAEQPQRERLIGYGKTIGLAFQLADDLLDVTSDEATMGKAVQKDADRGKGTLVAIHGVTKVQEMLDAAVKEADACLEGFGSEASELRATAHFIAHRKN